MDNERYFSGIRREYQDAIEYSGEVYRNIAARLDGLLRGRVIDFGNGGVINYRTDGLERLLCVDIVAPAAQSRGNIEYAQGDFYTFEFPGATDAVLTQFLLHHLPDDDRLDAALARLRGSLGSRGRLVVVEMVLPGIAERLQAALRPLLRALLRASGKPELRFFSMRSLTATLRRAGFTRLETQRIEVGRWIAPAPVLFPRLRMPGRLYPLRCVLVEASGGP